MASTWEVVHEWHTVLNDGDVGQLTSLVREDVEVGGPRGTARGVQVLRDWFGRANITLTPTRYFSRDEFVVVEEEGEWISANSKQIVTTAFVVTDGLIAHIMRYDNLESALKEAGLDESHRVQVD